MKTLLKIITLTVHFLLTIYKLKKLNVPDEIVKLNQHYRLAMQFDYNGSSSIGTEVVAAALGEIEEVLPAGYTIKRVRQQNEVNEIHSQYALLLLIVVLIYFLTSILFNSLIQPLYIISVIPISFMGVFLAFYLFVITFDQGGFASFILIIGLTINSYIYLIDEFNRIKKKRPGLNQLQIYLKAYHRKFRPIMLTIISTILGFIPFILGSFKEAFWYSLAIGTIGGLIVSVIATFVFLPLFMGVAKSDNI